MLRKRVYVAAPISRGDLLTNVNRATDAFLELAAAGFAPLNPVFSVYAKSAFRGGFYNPMAVMCEATAEGNPQMSHAHWLDIDLPWVACADAVLRLPGDSVGADAETAFARERGIPVFATVAEVVAHFADGEDPSLCPECAGHGRIPHPESGWLSDCPRCTPDEEPKPC